MIMFGHFFSNSRMLWVSAYCWKPTYHHCCLGTPPPSNFICLGCRGIMQKIPARLVRPWTPGPNWKSRTRSCHCSINISYTWQRSTGGFVYVKHRGFSGWEKNHTSSGHPCAHLMSERIIFFVKMQFNGDGIDNSWLDVMLTLGVRMKESTSDAGLLKYYQLGIKTMLQY